MKRFANYDSLKPNWMFSDILMISPFKHRLLGKWHKSLYNNDYDNNVPFFRNRSNSRVLWKGHSAKAISNLPLAMYILKAEKIDASLNLRMKSCVSLVLLFALQYQQNTEIKQKMQTLSRIIRRWSFATTSTCKNEIGVSVLLWPRKTALCPLHGCIRPILLSLHKTFIIWRRWYSVDDVVSWKSYDHTCNNTLVQTRDNVRVNNAFFIETMLILKAISSISKRHVINRILH